MSGFAMYVAFQISGPISPVRGRNYVDLLRSAESAVTMVVIVGQP
jgi:hypothetical protein